MVGPELDRIGETDFVPWLIDRGDVEKKISPWTCESAKNVSVRNTTEKVGEGWEARNPIAIKIGRQEPWGRRDEPLCPRVAQEKKWWRLKKGNGQKRVYPCDVGGKTIYSATCFCLWGVRGQKKRVL